MLITAVQSFQPLEVAVRVATVTLLYCLARWPVPVALATLPLLLIQLGPGLHLPSMVLLVPFVVTSALQF